MFSALEYATKHFFVMWQGVDEQSQQYEWHSRLMNSGRIWTEQAQELLNPSCLSCLTLSSILYSEAGNDAILSVTSDNFWFLSSLFLFSSLNSTSSCFLCMQTRTLSAHLVVYLIHGTCLVNAEGFICIHGILKNAYWQHSNFNEVYL